MLEEQPEGKICSPNTSMDISNRGSIFNNGSVTPQQIEEWCGLGGENSAVLDLVSDAIVLPSRCMAGVQPRHSVNL
jgi:hypothetical protein